MRSHTVIARAAKQSSFGAHVWIAGKTMKNRLKILRAERDWSQAELGNQLDVSRQAVNAIETGKYDPSLPLAFKIARLFDMKIEEIFDDGAGNAR
jgi:putative transcriptional regulator